MSGPTKAELEQRIADEAARYVADIAKLVDSLRESEDGRIAAMREVDYVKRTHADELKQRDATLADVRTREVTDAETLALARCVEAVEAMKAAATTKWDWARHDDEINARCTAEENLMVARLILCLAVRYDIEYPQSETLGR